MKRLRVADAGIEIEFYEGHDGAPVAEAPGMDDEADASDLQPGSDPFADRMTFGGREPPTWGSRPRRDQPAREGDED